MDVVDMTVADSDPDSEINNCMADLVEPDRKRTTRGVHERDHDGHSKRCEV